jgi:serine/threonine protein kinase/Tfp pilus assembly protein PilF
MNAELELDARRLLPLPQSGAGPVAAGNARNRMNSGEDRTSGCAVMAEQPSRPSAAPSEDARVIRAMHEYLAALEAGQPPDRAAFLDRHADIAEALADCLEGLEFVHGLAPELSPADEGDRAGEPAATDLQLEVPLGDYRIVREIGRGGMGVVYEAMQLSLGRRVALKVLPFAAALDPRQLQRFRNEAQAAAHLHHSNIVPVFGVGCERGVHFYAMQFIEGQTLAAVIGELRRAENEPEALATVTPRASVAVAEHQGKDEAVTTPHGQGAVTEETPARASLTTLGERRGREYYRKVAELGVQAAQALEYAHQTGVVHRDIKPANLLVDARGNLWITDFGLAHVQSDAPLTLTGDLIGTLRYMSPEQALGQRDLVDRRSDLYSLGVTLYESLTLKPAFAGGDRQELLRQIAFEEAPAPRRRNRAIPRELETIVSKAMARRPAERYGTAQELADDLSRFLKDEPIRARRPTPWQRARKWARRHRPVVWSVAVVLLLALAFAAANVWWWAQKRATAAGAAREALREAARLQQQEKWPEAQDAVRRAEELLTGVGAVEDLRRQVERMSRDLEMVRRLQEARLQLAAINDGQPQWEAINAAFGEAFAWYGLDLETLELPGAANRIRSHAIHVQLAAALDHLAFLRRKAGVQGWMHLLEISQAVNPDPWRGRIRDALRNTDARACDELVASALNDEPSPTMAVLLSGITRGTPAARRMVRILRKVRRRYPADVWVSLELALCLYDLQPPGLEEAIRYLTAIVALRPESPGARVSLGAALAAKGLLDEAIAEHREALRLQKDYATAHNSLGAALSAKGLVDEAIAEHREALRLQKDYASAHNNLGVALESKGQVDEAIAEYRKALRLQKDWTVAHINLGHALKAKGKVDEAIAEFRAALRLNKDDEVAHNHLGLALADKSQIDEAIGEFREAIRLNKDFAEAHYSLGLLLLKQGQFTAALAELKQSHELGSRIPGWHRPSAQWFHLAQRLVRLDDLLSRVLQGKARPDATDRLNLAWFCQVHKKRYVAAVRFYEEAFTALSRLGDKPRWGHRYNAARAAVLAAAGQGNDAARLNDPERQRLRRQALDWLRADLTHWAKQGKSMSPSPRTDFERALRHWKRAPDLAGVRDEVALSNLPEVERQAWRTFWADVENVLADIRHQRRPQQKPPSKL